MASSLDRCAAAACAELAARFTRVRAGVDAGFGDAAVRDKYNLGSPSNITRLKKSMIDKELVELTAKGIVLGDPVLKRWLQRILG